MIDDLILNFPVIKNNSGDFVESVCYKVEASQASNHRKLYITHTLTGDSFVADLIKAKKAKFSVSLFYKDSRERQKFICDKFYYDNEANEITAEQEINIVFSYAPEIIPNIIILENETITVDFKSGLTSFWASEKFDIPSFSRIAYHQKLKFSSGDVSSLMWKDMDESYQDGTIRVIVMQNAKESEQPIKLICAKDVYDELDRGFSSNDIAEIAIRRSIITQVLCHVYAYMNNLKDKENDIHDGLLLHMEMVSEKTQQDWIDSDNFNASFAATQMVPYAIESLNNEDNK